MVTELRLRNKYTVLKDSQYRPRSDCYHGSTLRFDSMKHSIVTSRSSPIKIHYFGGF